MDRYDGDVATTMPAEVEKFVHDTVCNMLVPCRCHDYWEVKLAEAVDSQRQLQEQVYVLLQRLEEADVRCAKSREEASLNAQALKRQVAETRRLAAECKSLTLDCEALTQECTRLENECNLYHNDREVFMEAADEAEERAAQAQDRAEEANQKMKEMLQKLENIRGCTAAVHPLPAESVDVEDVPALRLKLADLETKLQRRQDEADTVNSCIEVEHHNAEKLIRERNLQLEIQLTEANKRYEETSTELERIREACSAMETARDELSVSRMVSSAVSAGLVRALEQERDDAISSLNLQFKAILRRMQGEFRSSRERLLKKWTEGEGSRERMKVYEKGMKSLLMEAEALRLEVANCKDNLEKAQEQIYLLAEENKELRLLLKNKLSNGKLQDEFAGDEKESVSLGAAQTTLLPLRICLFKSCKWPLNPNFDLQHFSHAILGLEKKSYERPAIQHGFCFEDADCDATTELATRCCIM